MALDRLNPQDILGHMIGFMRLGPENNVNNFILTGPVRDEPVEFVVIAGLFPALVVDQNIASAIITTNPEDKKRAPHYHSRILNLSIPQRIKDLDLRRIYPLERHWN